MTWGRLEWIFNFTALSDMLAFSLVEIWIRQLNRSRVKPGQSRLILGQVRNRSGETEITGE